MTERAVRILFPIVLIVALAQPARAHAAYRDSDPPNESTVSAPPSSVWAEFTEPVTEDSRLEVFDPCGGQVDDGNSQVTGYRITVGMSADKAGTYRVAFSVISTLDGHPTRGEFVFTSTGGAACPGAEPEEPEQEEPEVEQRKSGDRAKSASLTTSAGDNDEGSRARESGDERDRSKERSGQGAHHRAGKRSAGGLDRLAQALEGVERDDSVPKEPGIWDGIPLGAFGVALLLAALIGAAGGNIYAGIVGSQREPRSRKS